MYLQEAAGALASFADDPIALVTACRRLVDRQPANAAVWWLTARVLGSSEPENEAWVAAEAGDDDSVSDVLTDLVPEGATVVVLGWPDLVGSAIARRGDLEVRLIDIDDEGSSFARRLERRGFSVELIAERGIGPAVSTADLVLVEATCLGPDGAYVGPGSRAAVSVAFVEGIDTWLVATESHVLPGPLFDAYGRRNAVEQEWEGAMELLPARLIGTCLTAVGLTDLAGAAIMSSAPVVGELLR
jgi:hypothetical protein